MWTTLKCNTPIDICTDASFFFLQNIKKSCILTETHKSVLSCIYFFFTKPSYNDVGADYPEVEYFDVTLMKDNQGLGITIAGYVGKDNTPGRLKWGQCRKGGGGG